MNKAQLILEKAQYLFKMELAPESQVVFKAYVTGLTDEPMKAVIIKDDAEVNETNVKLEYYKKEQERANSEIVQLRKELSNYKEQNKAQVESTKPYDKQDSKSWNKGQTNKNID